MKKLLVGVLFFAISISAVYAKTYTVTLATENLEADAPLIEALTAKGFKVYATNKYWQGITEGKVNELNNYDLLVITRQTNSSSYVGSDGTYDLWADVTTPIINMSQYLGRSSKMQWFNTESIAEDIGSAMLAQKTSHPIFTGIDLDESMHTSTLASPGFNGFSVTDAGNGTVVASSTTTGYVAIAEWGVDTAFYTDAIDPLPLNKGRRMWFSGTKNPDGYAYTETGINLFLNAVEYMITGEISDGSEPINSNKIQAESFASINSVSVIASSDTTGGDDIVFTSKGQWAQYDIEVEVADYYTFYLRTTSTSIKDTLRIYDEGTIIGHVIVNGGNWSTVNIPLQFASSGTRSVKIEAISDVDSVRMNWLDYVEQGLGSSSLVFNSSAQPSEIILNGWNILGSSSPGTFTLVEFDGKQMNKSTSFSCTSSGNLYTVKHAEKDLEFTFRADAYPRHISLHLVDVKGNVADRQHALQLRIRFNQKMSFKTTSDLIGAGWLTTNNDLLLYWRNLWGVEPDGKRGGIILWEDNLSDNDLDLVLAEIWSTEKDMVIPGGQASWTSSDILYWVDNYAARFNNLSQVLLEPRSHTELYEMTQNLVEPINAKQVYLHCGTWREQYWLRDRDMVYVNTEMFPNGKADLKAYADYLHDRGINLALHSLSYGIGPSDPQYIGETVDRRLAKWTSGTLEAAINTTSNRILYRPDSVEMPFMAGGVHTHGCIYFDYMRIGEEIVRVESFNRTERDVWVVNLKERGHGASNAYSHPKGTEMVGIFKPYNKNFIPEFDMGQENSLSDAMIKKYYDFVNEIGLDHLHFDGPEIHRIYRWASRPMLDAAYAGTNHPTTTSRVGSNLDASFELEFSKVKDDLSYSYFGLEIGLRLHDADPEKLASSFMSVHMHAGECILLNARRVQFSGIKNANGITMEAMENHGLTENSMSMYRYWQELAPLITDADVSYINSNYNKTSGSNHYESEDVLVLSKNDEDKYIFTPYHVLGYADGSTSPWYIKQEYGAMRRSIFIGTDEPIALTNLKGERDLNLIIRVVENSPDITDPGVELSSGGYINFTGTMSAQQYLRYEVGDTVATICDKNWMPVDTMPVESQSNFVAPDGAITATMKGSDGASLEVQLYVMDDPYVLTTNDVLE